MVDCDRQAGVQSSDKVFALGDRGVVVPKGMTAEMVMAGARVLMERVPEDVTSDGRIPYYTAQILAREIWAAIVAAAAEPSSAVPLSRQPHS